VACQVQVDSESLGITQIPSHIWNCDETGLQDVFLPSKVVGEKGIPAYQVTAGERRNGHRVGMLQRSWNSCTIAGHLPREETET